MYQVILKSGVKETEIHSPYFNGLKLESGTIKHGINVASNFSFSILPNNPGYYLINPLKTLIKVKNLQTKEMEFEAFLFMPTESMRESVSLGKSFTAVSELGYLKQSSQRHGEYHYKSVRDFLQIIINNHNADIANDDIDKRFELGVVDVDSSTSTVYRYLGYESTFDTIQDKLIDRLGGELRVRKKNGIRYLDYIRLIGEHKSTEIRLAKNLKAITKEVDPTDLITRLIPLGERIESEDEEATDASEARLTIESVNNGKDYIDDEEAMAVFGVIAKSESWDDITQPNILKTRGGQFLKENNRVKSKYQITALDLSLIDLDIESFEVGNYYPVINPLMGIDEHLRIVGKSIDILNPEQSSLDIGDKFMTASQYQSEANRSRKKVVELESTVSRQSRRVSELSKASKQAQEEIQVLHELIDNINMDEVDETLDLIVQQVVEISDSINDIGYEITEVGLRTIALEEFKEAQEEINHNQTIKNQEFDGRLLALEQPEEGDS